MTQMICLQIDNQREGVIDRDCHLTINFLLRAPARLTHLLSLVVQRLLDHCIRYTSGLKSCRSGEFLNLY